MTRKCQGKHTQVERIEGANKSAFCGIIKGEKGVFMKYKHASDLEKQKIIADYVQCGNYSEVARMNKCSATKVKNIVLKSGDVLEKCEQKKEENTKDILEYMDSKKDMVCKMIDLYLEEFCSEERIKTSTTAQLATAFGVVIDKFVPKDKQKSNNEVENLSMLKDLLK